MLFRNMISPDIYKLRNEGIIFDSRGKFGSLFRHQDDTL